MEPTNETVLTMQQMQNQLIGVFFKIVFLVLFINMVIGAFKLLSGHSSEDDISVGILKGVFYMLAGPFMIIWLIISLTLKPQIKWRAKRIRKLREKRQQLEIMLQMEVDGMVIHPETFKKLGYMDEYQKRMAAIEQIRQQARKDAKVTLRKEGLL